MPLRRTLGDSAVQVTPFGLGTAALASPTPAHLGDAVADALAAGIGLVDTAPMYGCGDAERALGAAPAREAPVTLSTKVGRIIRPLAPGESPADVPPVHTTRHGRRTDFDFTAPGVRRSLHDSIDRLAGRRPDVVYVHDPDAHAEEAWRGAIPEALDWRERGEVAAVGIGMNRAELLARAIEEFPLDAVLLAGRYTLLDRSGTALLDRCAERGVGVVIGGVFNSGLLADPEGAATFDYGPAGARERAAARRLAQVCREHGVDLKAAALQFPLRHPAVASVLLGPATPAQLDELLVATTTRLPEELWDALDAARER